ncbi:MAG: L-histidine N(alpha)-methyltransferase [Terriglobales bacterium]
MAQALTICAPESELLRDVRQGLLRSGQKTLPCKYLYDEPGSLLFDAICALPEYGLAAADERLLRTHAAAMLVPLRPEVMVAELGSGSARKTRWLLQALCRRRPTLYWPIEISPRALEGSRRELSEMRGLELRPLSADYLGGLAVLARLRTQSRLAKRPLLVLFLGSTLGNFHRPEAAVFLRAVRGLLRPGDALLLGLDLIKPAPLLRRAYDDPAGVTAAFNKNLLARLNRELGTDFNLAHWQHRALWRGGERRIEMHLRARRAQSVHLPGGEEVTFARGETIWTESSHKFHRDEIAALLAGSGFRLQQQWLDAAWPFAESLALVN